MAYRGVEMWEILNVLRRVSRGESKAAIKRATGYSRKTIRRYVEVARELGWAWGLVEPDEALAAAVAERIRPGPRDAGPGSTERRLLPHRERIRAWLEPGARERRGLRLTKVHRLLAREGIEVPYSSLHRFAVKHCGFSEGRRLTVRVAEVAPGELAEVDFGKLGLVADPETGRRRVLHALIVTLVHSRHQYVHVTHTQKLPDLIEGLEDAWAFFGGVPARVILDNLKGAITKPDRYEPIFQRTFEEYARYRGFVIDAALPRHARGKPHVERGVPYVRDHFFRGESWRDREHVQREAIRWCLEVAGTRIHGTTRERPLAVFENRERSALQPLEKPRFDPPIWAQCKVHLDHHISFLRASYTVPTRHVGKTVWVRGDRKLVRIYVGGQLVKTHERQPPGGRSTDYKDYPPERAPYAMRDPDRMIQEARQHGAELGRFMERLLAGAFPWAHLRQAQKLLRLGGKYGWSRVEAACARALRFDLINVKRVERMIQAGLETDALPTPTRPSDEGAQRQFRFARPPGSFNHCQGGPDGRDPTLAEDGTQTLAALGPDADSARSHRLRPQGETR
jgi:transposase